MNFEMRIAGPSDAQDLASVLQDALAKKAQKNDRIWTPYSFTEDEVSEMIKTGNMHLADVDGDLAGAVALQWEDERTWGKEKGLDDQAGYIHRLSTKEIYRGKGIGKKIVSWAEAEVAANGRPFLRLDCEFTNEGLCSYYEELGFKQIDRLTLPRGYQVAYYQKSV